VSESNDPTAVPETAAPTAPTDWGPRYGAPLGYPAGPPPGGQPQYGQPQYGQPQQGQPQYGQPQYGQPQYGQPQYGQPQYGQPQYGQPQYGQPGGYVPPPVQRGIVPLRPLSLGEIYDGAFRSIRANPRVMFGFSAIIVAIACLVGGLLWYLLIPTISGWFGDVGQTMDTSEQAAFESTTGALGSYAMLPFLLLATAVLTGVLTVSVSRSVIGQTITVADLWHRHWRRVLVVVAYTAAFGVLTAVAWALAIFLIVLAWTASVAGGVVLMILLVGGMAVASVWVSTRLLLVPPVLVLEDAPVMASIARAWRLTRGSFWRIFGIYLLASIIANIASSVLSVPMSFVSLLFMTEGTISGGYVAAMSVGMALSYALPAVFLAAVVALQYVDVRIRREGLDVQLTRAAETAAQNAEAR
jgi:hypothetical protein